MPGGANLRNCDLARTLAEPYHLLSALAGEISEIQIEFAHIGRSQRLIKRASKAIGACHRLAIKYELDKQVSFFGNNIHNMSDKNVLNGIV